MLRQSSHARGYGRDWQAFRLYYARNVKAPLCVKCGGVPDSMHDMHLDHVKPLSQGGARLDERNVQWLCSACHEAKTRSESRVATTVTP